MRALWLLAINNLAGRKGRTALLVLAVAMASALSGAVAVGVRSITESVTSAFSQLVGNADLRIVHSTDRAFDASFVKDLRNREEVVDVAIQLESNLLRAYLPGTDQTTTLHLRGIEREAHEHFHPDGATHGRLPEQEDEIALDRMAMDRLGAKIGDVIGIGADDSDVRLTVVGMVHRPAIGIFTKVVGIVDLETARNIANQPNQATLLEVSLRNGTDEPAFIKSIASQLPASVESQRPSDIQENMALLSSTLWSASVAIMSLVYLSSGFIIFTGMTTSVMQRVRELAMLRCVGVGRWTLAGSQLLSGIAIALLGLMVGLPLGVAILLGLYESSTLFQQLIEAGIHVTLADLTVPCVAAILAGVIGSLYPAYTAGRVRPLQALAARASAPSRYTLTGMTILGLLMVCLQPLVLQRITNDDLAFYAYIFLGLPCLVLGMFLLSVPLLVLLSYSFLPVLARLLSVPVALLRGPLLASPYRNGFTGGALMVGLMLLLAVWTGGRSVLYDMSKDIRMPELYITGGFGNMFSTIGSGSFVLHPEQWKRITEMPGVEKACPSMVVRPKLVDVSFGLPNVNINTVHFLAFDPDCFFDMTYIDWVDGDPQQAIARLEQGNAILISRQYHYAHGAGVGDTVTVQVGDKTTTFDIVGIIRNKGLEIAVQAMGLDKQFEDASVSFLFGTRADAKRLWDREEIDVVLVKTQEGTDVEALRVKMQQEVGVIAISAKAILQRVRTMINATMWAISAIALLSLIITSLGVTNLLAAEVAARRHEFGVIRAVGGQRGLLARMVTSQAILLGLVGCLIGTIAAFEVVWIRDQFDKRLMGVTYDMVIPWDVVAFGWSVVILVAVIASLPTAWSLLRRQPRDLLGSSAA